LEEKRPEPRSRWLDVGWLIAGAIILFVGAYYVIRNTLGFDLPELDGEALWPLAVIALGIGILWRTWWVYNHPGAKI
jgi:hypothetical protein